MLADPKTASSEFLDNSSHQGPGDSDQVHFMQKLHNKARWSLGLFWIQVQRNWKTDIHLWAALVFFPVQEMLELAFWWCLFLGSGETSQSPSVSASQRNPTGKESFEKTWHQVPWMHLCIFLQDHAVFVNRVSVMEKGFFLKGGLGLPVLCVFTELWVRPHRRFRPVWIGHWSYGKDTQAHLAPHHSPWPNPALTRVGLKTGLEKRAHVLWGQVEGTNDPKEIKVDEVLLRVQGEMSSEPWGLRPVLGVHWWGDRSGPWTQGWGGWEKTLFSSCVWLCPSSLTPDPSLIFF